MSALCHHSNCQPNRCLFLHLTNRTHALTPHSYQHQPEHVITNVHIASNNPHVIYTHVSPDKDPTITLIHLTRTTRPVHKRTQRPRVTNTLHTVTRIITLSPPSSSLHQETTHITTAHLVLAAPQIKKSPWNIIRHTDLTQHILSRVMAALSLTTTYPIWKNPSTSPTTTLCSPLLTLRAAYNLALTSIDTHLSPPPSPSLHPLPHSPKKEETLEKERGGV